jgi:hypothetical protein
MRKLISVAGAAMLAVTTFATPASAAGTASGSCGNAAGNYGWNSLYPDLYGDGMTVPSVFYQINYSGVEAGTTVGAIIYRDEDLNSYISQVAQVAEGTSGSIRAALGSNWANPAAQGGGNSINQARRGAADGPADGGRATRTQNSGYTGGGGVVPGLYTFHIYEGSIQNIVRDPKEGLGPQPTFVADESKPLGTFSCAVQDDEAKN